MANYTDLKAAVAAVIKANGNNEITGNILQNALLTMIDALGQYSTFVGNAVPATNPGTPDSNVFYFASTPGTYPNFGGLVVNPGEFHIFRNNSSNAWISILIFDVKLFGSDLITETGNLFVTQKGVYDYALSKNSERILPYNYEISDFDRPDLDLSVDFVIISIEGYIISKNWGIDYSMLIDYSFDDFDRPDLSGIVEVDVNYFILSGVNSPNESTIALDVNTISLFSKKFYEPSVVDEFQSANIWDYDLLISQWDDILNKANQYSSYCLKTEIGRTSTKDLPIYTYEFLPENPKVKILVTTGMHGSEKIYIHLMRLFFDRLVDGWTTDVLLEWIRLNVHFIVVPCLSPSCLTGIAPESSGGRRVHETDPINVSWTKSGNDVTVTYELADFPETDGRLDANAYFSNGNIVGKTWISLFDSSLSAELPNKGYVIKSVVNGRTIIIETENSGTASGTAKLYVGVDINRNMQADGSNIWNNFTPTPTSSTMYSNDYVPNPNDNKGTKPFSLTESIALRDLLLNNPDILFFVDFHSGAGNNYLHWNTIIAPGQDIAINELKENQSIFNNDGYSRVVADSLSIPYSAKYTVEQLGKPGFTLEWQQSATTTSKSATDAMRWLSTFFISFIRNLNIE